MSLVNVLNVSIPQNPVHFMEPFAFEITFECLQTLEDDLEWKVTYVVNAEDDSCDQLLEECLVGPNPAGVNKFLLQAPAPDSNNLPIKELLDVTVVLISCSYLGSEFVKIGYYLKNDYTEPLDPENMPATLDSSKIFRYMLVDEPRVTCFPIAWSRTTQGVEPTDEDVAQAMHYEETFNAEVELGEDEDAAIMDTTALTNGEGEEEEDCNDSDEIDLECGSEDCTDEDMEGNNSFEEMDVTDKENYYDLGNHPNEYIINEDSVDVGMIHHQISGQQIVDTYSRSAFSNL